LDLSFLIEEIKGNISNRENYTSFILKDIKILEENENDVELFPIVNVEIEVEDSEITLLSSELNEDLEKDFKPLLLKDLFKKLNEMNPQCHSFELFSGSSVFKIDEEHYGRKDTPLVAFGFNDEDNTFVLIQSEPSNRNNA
jgi:hypothetical protein